MKTLGFTINGLLLAVVVFWGTCVKSYAQEDAAPASNSEITFEELEFDFGTIKNAADPDGHDGRTEFKFTNTGTDPLIITKARGSCGCTVPTWPKEPIAPGESGVIKVKYDTKRTGPFTKTVTINSNAKSATATLKIKGKVLPPAAEDDFTPLNKENGSESVPREED